MVVFAAWISRSAWSACSSSRRLPPSNAAVCSLRELALRRRDPTPTRDINRTRNAGTSVAGVDGRGREADSSRRKFPRVYGDGDCHIPWVVGRRRLLFSALRGTRLGQVGRGRRVHRPVHPGLRPRPERRVLTTQPTRRRDQRLAVERSNINVRHYASLGGVPAATGLPGHHDPGRGVVPDLAAAVTFLVHPGRCTPHTVPLSSRRTAAPGSSTWRCVARAVRARSGRRRSGSGRARRGWARP